MTIPSELPYETCLKLLTTHEVGRVAVCTSAGPRIVPVNYTVADDSVLFRTTPYSILGMQAWSARLAFEIDEFDAEQRSGWSVVAVGNGEVIEDTVELRRIQSGPNPVPWAGGQRWLYVRLPWSDLTGRRVGKHATLVT